MLPEPVHYDVQDAKSHLSRIVERVKRGEEITDRAGTPGVRVVPQAARVKRTAVGSLTGQVDFSGDWDSPHTNGEIAADFLAGHRDGEVGVSHDETFS